MFIKNNTRTAIYSDPVTGKQIAAPAEVGVIESAPPILTAGESKPVPVFVEPVLPAPSAPTDYDESPLYRRIELERKALNIIRDKSEQIAVLETNIADCGTPADTMNEAINRVWNGQFHTDNSGQRLIKFLDVRGNHHAQHLMESGAFDPLVNGGFIQRYQRLLSGSTTRIFMVHQSTTLDELYRHPENIAAVTDVYDRKREHLERRLSELRIDLADYKAAVRDDLKHLDKLSKNIFA
ncbi:hypothetical protein [Citrobacter portucalensis]|uniref:hypothetical protein n=1 Tax=Citrobacter portucalensis TaxID=1639133 RepID=UPI00226B0B94|nr:hypothetical protein [Citrobacter portucalensis]MCX8984456.1 hypothetical protein [Citrobacter portucalensis]